MSEKKTRSSRLSRRGFIHSSLSVAVGLGLAGKNKLFGENGQEAPAKKSKIKEYRTLGRTGFKVSDISFGAGSLDDSALLEAALDMGVNYVQEKSQDQPGKTKQLEDNKWTLQSYGESGNLKDVLADTKITAEFVSPEETVKGSAGCNSYFGSYELKGSQLSVPGPLGVTEMYCMEPEGVMEQEQEYLAILQLAESYKIDDDELRINCGSQFLIFKSD